MADTRTPFGRAVAVALALIMLAGCFSNRALRTRVSPQAALAELNSGAGDAGVGIVMVTLDDGSQVEFVEPVVVGSDGVMRGLACPDPGDARREARPVAIAWQRVESAVLEREVRKFSWARTGGLVVAVVAAAARRSRVARHHARLRELAVAVGGAVEAVAALLGAHPG